MTNQTSVADTAATQILAHEILYDIGVPASREMVSRISARLEEAVDQAVRGRMRRPISPTPSEHSVPILPTPVSAQRVAQRLFRRERAVERRQALRRRRRMSGWVRASVFHQRS